VKNPDAAAPVWFVVGASGGLGSALTALATERGALVVAGYCETEVDDQAAGWMTAQLDIAEASSVRAAVSDVLVSLGRIDVIVDCAGRGLIGALEECDDYSVRDVLATNLIGALNLARAVVPVLRRQRTGHLIYIGATVAERPRAGAAVYAASKAAVNAFAHALHEELKPFGVRVTVITPGAVRTEFVTRSTTWAPPLEPYEATRSDVRALLHAPVSPNALTPDDVAELGWAAVADENAPIRLAASQTVIRSARRSLEAQGRVLDSAEDFLRVRCTEADTS